MLLANQLVPKFHSSSRYPSPQTLPFSIGLSATLPVYYLESQHLMGC